MNTTFGFMDILIVFSGAYLVYAAVQMKRTGEITSSAIIGKGYDPKKAKDPKGLAGMTLPGVRVPRTNLPGMILPGWKLYTPQ